MWEGNLVSHVQDLAVVVSRTGGFRKSGALLGGPFKVRIYSIWGLKGGYPLILGDTELQLSPAQARLGLHPRSEV